MDLQEQVNDIQWSPHTSSVFASVANDGRIEIWDLYEDPLEPMKLWYDKGPDGENDPTKKTSVRWSRTSPILVSGNEKGIVDVYRTFGLEHVQVSEQDQVNRILSSIKKDDFAAD